MSAPTTDISEMVIAEESVGCFSCLPSFRRKSSHDHARTSAPNGTSAFETPERRPRSTSQMTVTSEALYHETLDSSIIPVSGDDSLYFFDAVEDLDELEDDQYPIITTSTIKPKKLVLMDHPETLLMDDAMLPETQQEVPQSPQRFSSVRKLSKKMHHMRVNSNSMMDGLQEPRIATQERGFPGSLTKEEVAECLRFQRELKKRDKVLSDIVFHYEFEEEPYALCRFLRATKFDGDKMLERLESTKGEWERVAAQNFYPDIENALGCPFSLFLSQYPFTQLGIAKNGFPVQYFQAGKINPEGLLCLTTCEKADAYFWHQSVHLYRKAILSAMALNPNVVRLESVTIIDLKGFTTSSVTSDTLDVIKRSGKVADFFPESLHCMLIINAPTIFSMSWTLIRKLIDPRTARRIQVFSNLNKGLARLYELVDKSQIPMDYGGTNKSVNEAFFDAGVGAVGNARQDTELLHVKRRGKTDHIFEIEKGEVLSVRVYTRSATSARITLARDDHGHDKLGECELRGEDCRTADGTFTCSPSHKEIASQICGPGKIQLTVIDQDDVSKERSNLSRGYFLVEKHISSN